MNKSMGPTGLSDESQEKANTACVTLADLLERSLTNDFSGTVGVKVGIKRGTIQFVNEETSRNR